MMAFREGDVLSYDSERPNRWCREGTAVAFARESSIVLVDTFWDFGGSESHVLTEAEMATARPRFNLNDYDELDRFKSESRATWMKYAPADREVITSQHGLTCRWFTLKGASEDLGTQIENARAEVDEAWRKVRSAISSLKSARQRLAELESRASVATS